MAERFAASVTGGATSYALAHSDREFGYMLHFRRNINRLKLKIEQLEATVDDLQRRVEVSRNNNEVTRKVVIDWLAKVDTVLGKVRQLSDKAAKINRWYKGWPFSRFYLGRKAFKKIDEIQELVDERSQLVTVGDPKPFQSLELVSFGDFQAFASREDTTNKIINALREKSTVGIYGMPGVGKTKLMRAIAKHAKDEKLFDEVVMVIISQNPDIGTIQKDIARQLGLHLGESSVAGAQLSERLNNRGKKILIAFDDVWQRLDLDRVGIPHKSNIHCKVLLTTRSQSICDQMEADVNIQVGVLSEADSWRLFRLKAGDVADSSSHREVAQDVLNECKGLPLAIVTLGLALRNKDIIVWRDALAQLKKSIFEGMNCIITIVKVSYDFLHGDKAAQMCFLLCSLFPEDFPIKNEVLLSYILGEGLLGKEVNMEEARNRLHAIIDKLVSSGMLLIYKEDDYDKGNIMMHDVIRDAAISIASDPEEGEGFIVRSGLGLTEWPPIDREMEKCKRLSLMGNDLVFCPPHQLTASLLLTLSLFQNKNLEVIPSDFFKGMKHLKTLDLSNTSITSLPESFQCLKSLHTLLMDHCYNLIDISLVVELEMLEILSLFASPDVQMPVSMQKLTNLKMLNTCHVTSKFPPRVISSLHRLEELYLGGFGTETELVFSEVASLTRLTSLHIRLPIECMLKDFPIHWKNLSRFSIYVGETDFMMNTEFGAITRKLSLALRSSNQIWIPSIQKSNWVGVLLEKIKVLKVFEHDYFLIFEELNANCLYQDLFHLSITGCKLLRHLLSTTSTITRKPIFCNLEELDLHYLNNFVGICDGPLPEGCLSKLRVLTVNYCPRVRTLIPGIGNLQNLEKIELINCEGLENVVEFEAYMSKHPPSLTFPCLRRIDIRYCDKLKYGLPLKAARDLLQLEELTIMHCLCMEMVFEGDRDDADKGKTILPRLKKLKLLELPSLTGFGSPGSLFDFPVLTKINMRTDYMKLKSLPFVGKQSIPKLKELEVESGLLDGLEWEDESLKLHLKSLPGLVEYKLHADGSLRGSINISPWPVHPLDESNLDDKIYNFA